VTLTITSKTDFTESLRTGKPSDSRMHHDVATLERHQKNSKRRGIAHHGLKMASCSKLRARGKKFMKTMPNVLPNGQGGLFTIDT
jgi:hypothetical protein